MANKIFSRNEHVFATKETAYGTVVSPANGDALRGIKLNLNNEAALLRRRDKTGSRTAIAGVRGRIFGKWSYEGSLIGSTGGVPDADVFFQMLFGQAGTANAYTFADTIVSGDLWSYRKSGAGVATGVDQRVSVGSILQNFQFTLGQDIAEWTCDGESLGILGSSNFSTADTLLKGGLGAFPAEPASPTYTDPGAIAGFTGSITVDAQTAILIRTATIKGSTGNALTKDTFGSYYPTGTEGDERNINFSFSAYDDDTAGLAILKEAADKKTLVDATVVVGTVANSIFTFTLKGLQLASPQLDDSQRAYVINVGDSRASGTGLTTLDEFAMTIS